MPLEQSSSKAALSHNIAAEINAGKPPAQAKAIAYDVQRRNDSIQDNPIDRAIALLEASQSPIDKAIELAEKLCAPKDDSVSVADSADFKESDHPRAENGQFGSGGGKSNSTTRNMRIKDGRLIVDGKDIGMAEISKKTSSTRGGNGIEISRFYLNKDQQKKGIGSKFIDYLFDSHPLAEFIDVYPGGGSDPFWLKQGVESVDPDGTFRITRESRNQENKNKADSVYADADRWITVNSSGQKGAGIPALIGENGEVKAGIDSAVIADSADQYTATQIAQMTAENPSVRITGVVRPLTGYVIPLESSPIQK